MQSSIQQNQLQLVQINIDRVIATAVAERSGRSRDLRDKQITTATDVESAQANVKAAQTKCNRYEGVAKLGVSQDRFESAQLAVRQQEQALEAAKAGIAARASRSQSESCRSCDRNFAHRPRKSDGKSQHRHIK